MPESRDLLSTEDFEQAEPAESDRTVGRRPRSRWTIAALGVVGLLLVAYVVGALWAGDRIPRSTTVDGVAIGGLTRDEASAALDGELGSRVGEPIDVTAGTVTAALDPAEIGLSLDTAGTVDAASYGSAWNPAHLARFILGGGAVDPVVAIDDARLSAAVDQLAARAEVAAIDGSIAFPDASVEVIAPVPGQALDREAAANAIVAAFPGAGPVELPVEATQPAVDDAEVERARAEFADPAMSGPVTVVVGDTDVELTPAAVAPYLSMTSNGAGLAPTVDSEGLLADDASYFAAAAQPAVDASFTFEDGAPKLVPAVDGTAVDPASLAAGLIKALAASGTDRVAEVTVTPEPAELSTAEAQALGIKEPISEFTTHYPILEYRVINIGRAAELVHGSLVLPGETWSLNETVGERTAENGFVKGFIIDGGQFREDFGGGVSQLATTTFNAVFFAGLEDVEHKPHSFYISRYPAGREATVAWPTVDLRFRNDTDTGVLIQTIPEVGSITVRFWGTKAYDEVRSVSSERSNITEPETRFENSEECVDQPPVDGFDITVTRQFVQDGAVVRTEDFFTHYNPADRVICGPPAGG